MKEAIIMAQQLSNIKAIINKEQKPFKAYQRAMKKELAKLKALEKNISNEQKEKELNILRASLQASGILDKSGNLAAVYAIANE